MRVKEEFGLRVEQQDNTNLDNNSQRDIDSQHHNKVDEHRSIAEDNHNHSYTIVNIDNIVKRYNQDTFKVELILREEGAGTVMASLES